MASQTYDMLLFRMQAAGASRSLRAVVYSKSSGLLDWPRIHVSSAETLLVAGHWLAANRELLHGVAFVAKVSGFMTSHPNVIA